MSKKIVFRTEADLPPLAVSLGSMFWNKTGSWKYVKPLYDEKMPPCNQSCPAGEKIQGYIALIREKKYKEALQLIREDNPLPGVCGRVCYHPCETACNRGEFDEPIAIHALERLAFDYGQTRSAPKLPKKKGKRIGIIGSGPAGLSCAYHLARTGYNVVIFEALPKAGGMLQVGIPEYRLPREVLDYEIEELEKIGVEIKTGICIGRNRDFSELRKDFHAIFIATGMHQSKRLAIPGDGLEKVISGMKFLRDINLGKRVKIGKTVAVVGGGNTAMDAARSALRKGIKPVILYRRSRKEMPAHPEEIEGAEKEGISIMFLTTPIRVREKGKSLEIECVKMRLGMPDASGRRKPIPIPHSNFNLRVDAVISAIGEDPDLSFLPPEIKKDEKGIVVDDSLSTSCQGIFAGGDAVTRAGTVVEAIGSGKKAAQSIASFLENTPRKERGSSLRTVEFKDINLDYFCKAPRVKMPQLSFSRASRGFREINLGISSKSGVEEAERCFSCGVCNQCDNCLIYCPDISIRRKNNKYEIDYDHCKGCGICVEECPREAMSLVFV